MAITKEENERMERLVQRLANRRGMKILDGLITDRLPPEEEEVLVFAEYGLVVGYYGAYEPISGNEIRWWGSGYRKQEDFWLFGVRGWIPLPPKETWPKEELPIFKNPGEE